MSYTGYTLPNPLAAPGTLAPAGSVAETLPLPPPGRPVDGTCDLHPIITALAPAVKHVYTFLAAETITEGGAWTVTFTPTMFINGLPVGDAHRAITLNVTVGSTHTPTGFGDDLIAAFVDAKTTSTVAAISSATRIAEIIGSITNSSGTCTITGAIAGETYSVSYTAESGGSATVTNTVDASGTNMRIGVAVVKTGLHADGITPLVRACQSGDAASAVLGFVADGGTRVAAIDPVTGYSFRYYEPGRTLPIIPLKGGHGHWTAYAEAAVDDGDDVWVRMVATGSEVFGAVNDTPDEAVQVCTVTPTAAASGVLFHGFVQVFDRDGIQPIPPVPFYFAADADNTATETVTGIAADITTPLDGYTVISGTATLISTAVAGYTIQFVSTGAGILAAVYTGGTNDHVKIPNIKFSRTTTAAGSAAIQF
jgi:hypothetical protein